MLDVKKVLRNCIAGATVFVLLTVTASAAEVEKKDDEKKPSYATALGHCTLIAAGKLWTEGLPSPRIYSVKNEYTGEVKWYIDCFPDD